jgi:hypothetical protein
VNLIVFVVLLDAVDFAGLSHLFQHLFEVCGPFLHGQLSNLDVVVALN